MALLVGLSDSWTTVSGRLSPPGGDQEWANALSLQAAWSLPCQGWPVAEEKRQLAQLRCLFSQ